MDRGEKAAELFKNGANCAQAVTGAFADLIDGVDADVLSKLSLPFGGGMGRLREVCGTVTGMFIVLGLLSEDGASKKDVYPIVQQLASSFEKETGSIICRELLSGVKVTEGAIPEDRTPDYYKKRPCAELCRLSASILQEYLEKNQKQ